MKTIDAMQQFYGRAAELESSIREGNVSVDREQFLQRMEQMAEAISFFSSQPTYRNQLDNMVRHFLSKRWVTLFHVWEYQLQRWICCCEFLYRPVEKIKSGHPARTLLDIKQRGASVFEGEATISTWSWRVVTKVKALISGVSWSQNVVLMGFPQVGDI